MPFSIRKIGKNRYQVYNTATGEIHSKGTTKKKAEGQFRLLQGIARKELVDLEGGAKRSRTQAQWNAEENRIGERIEELDARLEALRDIDLNILDTLPPLPPNLYEGDQEWIIKNEIYGEFINSSVEDRDADYNHFHPQERIQINQWLRTIPHSVVEASIQREREKEALREEIREYEDDWDEIQDTENREATLGHSDTDSGTEMEGYGRHRQKLTTSVGRLPNVPLPSLHENREFSIMRPDFPERKITKLPIKLLAEHREILKREKRDAEKKIAELEDKIRTSKNPVVQGRAEYHQIELGKQIYSLKDEIEALKEEIENVQDFLDESTGSRSGRIYIAHDTGREVVGLGRYEVPSDPSYQPRRFL